MKRIFLSLVFLAGFCCGASATVFNVRDFGAKGDGMAVDSPAINAAIEAAADDGGGVVLIPSGKYLSYSIRLASHINLHFEKGACLIAANPTEKDGYDAPEPGPQPQFQDFGHSHWKNSFIWGIGLEDIVIDGFGFIDGSNLSEGYGDSAVKVGAGNKTISLKECRHVVIKDLTVYRGGHFVLLATGVDDMLLTGLVVDTARDGFDVDCCRNVRISDCLVNSPYDDGIVLKASYGLGRFKDTENVVVTNCNISAYQAGSVLDCTYRKFGPDSVNPHSGQTQWHRAGGRFKLGTESSGGFKNITLNNCTFSYCGGIFIESVDGGHTEDITISNCTMRECTDCPIFVRLGQRMRSPEGTPVGTVKRVLISDINAWNSNSVYGVQISATAGHYVEGLTLRNIHLNFEGGYSDSDALKSVPENIKAYPDPWMFGSRMATVAGPAVVMPCKGMFLRHVKDLTLDGVHFSYNAPDSRKLFFAEDVKAVTRDITLDGNAVKVKF